MVGVLADLFQVVVLAADADALLAVDRPGALRRPQSEEDVLELVHARVGEQQRLVAVRHDGRAGHEGVSFAEKELDETLSDGAGG